MHTRRSPAAHPSSTRSHPRVSASSSSFAQRVGPLGPVAEDVNVAGVVFGFSPDQARDRTRYTLTAAAARRPSANKGRAARKSDQFLRMPVSGEAGQIPGLAGLWGRVGVGASEDVGVAEGASADLLHRWCDGAGLLVLDRTVDGVFLAPAFLGGRPRARRPRGPRCAGPGGRRRSLGSRPPGERRSRLPLRRIGSRPRRHSRRGTRRPCCSGCCRGGPRQGCGGSP